MHIQPGKPTQNAHVESFHGRLREECLAAVGSRTYLMHGGRSRREKRGTTRPVRTATGIPNTRRVYCSSRKLRQS
ncbi:MAG TPA: integrase core domain-containing protein [Terriglobales bacterium]|nr:integrase core domain-containing protein [Terriglobales bacterium]